MLQSEVLFCVVLYSKTAFIEGVKDREKWTRQMGTLAEIGMNKPLTGFLTLKS